MRTVTQFFGKDFQQVSTIAVTLAHPQQICFNILSVQCTFISKISCGAATGNKLVVNGDLFTPSAGFEKLAIWLESANISAAAPAINAKALLQKGADPVTGFTVVGPGMGDVLTTNASAPFGLAAGNYYVGLIGAPVGNPPVTQSFYVYTGQRLVINGAGNCSVIK